MAVQGMCLLVIRFAFIRQVVGENALRCVQTFGEPLKCLKTVLGMTLHRVQRVEGTPETELVTVLGTERLGILIRYLSCIPVEASQRVACRRT
jgi:hypothetical protein